MKCRDGCLADELKDFYGDATCCETPVGWIHIIRNLAKVKPPYVKIRQIKEKFGGLRVYTTEGPPSWNQAIADAESEAWQTCADCGTRGAEVRSNGWLTVLCDGCCKT